MKRVPPTSRRQSGFTGHPRRQADRPPAGEDLLLESSRRLPRHDILDFKAEGASDAGAVGRIGAQAIGDVALLDVLLRVAHRSRRVLEQHLLLRRRHQPEQIARLLPVVVVGVVVIVRSLALDR